MQKTEQVLDRRMPRIEVEKGGTTMRSFEGGPVVFYQADVWIQLVENFKAGMYDFPK